MNSLKNLRKFFRRRFRGLYLVLERGKLVVSTHFGDAPWVFQDPKTGEPTGLIYDITKMYADEIGVEYEMMPFDFAGVIPALTSGKVDMIVASLSRTVPRSTKILYTDPYAVEVGSGFALKGKFKEMSELNNEEVRIVVTAGAIEEGMVPKLFPKATLVTVPTTADGVAAILSGRGDVYLSGRRIAIEIARTNPTLEVLPGTTNVDPFAVAVRFDSFKLWNSFNVFMRTIKLDGRYAELHKKWLGSDWVPLPITEMSL
jgi:ABC-type amino acid transport substrate-binding protein